MSIEIKPGRYFIGLWFVGNGREDWMAAAWKDAGDEHWTIMYRFRYYETPDPWDKKDRKSWHEGKSKPGEAEQAVKEKMDFMAQMVSLKFGKITFVPLYSDDAKENIERFKNASFAHWKELSKDEAEKEGWV